MSKQVLIVDDDMNIGNMLEDALSREDYQIIRAYSGTEALMVLDKETPDLILLDLMLPGITGEELLPKIQNIPVIVMSAKTDINDKVNVLLAGAADYVTKPFSMPILLRKINALVRRNDSPVNSNNAVCVCGDLLINKDTMEVMVSGSPVTLSAREFDLLLTLAKNPGRIYTREMLLDLLWDYNSLVDERIVDSHIKNLRHKLGGDYIETVRGKGYRIAKKDP